MILRGIGVDRRGNTRQAKIGPFTRLLLALTTCALVTTGLFAATLAPASSMTSSPVSAVATTSAAAAPTGFYERRVQRLVNMRREARGLPRLSLATCADDSAERWSRYLAARGEFFHQSMTDVLNRCNARYAGETLGRGTMSPRRLVQMWMQSPGHRAVLLSGKSRRIGVGATPDSTGRWVVAANFIRF